jgi:uncharacterized protein
VTDRLTLTWPSPAPFAGRAGRPLRLLAVSDETDASLESSRSRATVGALDLVIGCGDLEPPYLAFLADAFGVPLAYVRGNHDVGRAWGSGEHALLPEPLADGRLHREGGLPLLGFSGSPIYAPRYGPAAEQQVSGFAMWRHVLAAWPRTLAREPLLLLSHAAPRGLNDAADPAHRGFPAFRWLLERLAPPLWLHGHTSLVRRGLDGRCLRHGRTLLVNVTGAVLVELQPPGGA